MRCPGVHFATRDVGVDSSRLISPAGAPLLDRPLLDRRIRAFLDGETNGEDVLPLLYDHLLDEPIPPRLRALLKS